MSYDHVDAKRESFIYEGWPVESFIHDLETLRYFFWKVDRPEGIPSLAGMVQQGKLISEPNGYSSMARELASQVLSEGPPEWSADERKRARYAITDTVNDLRDPRGRDELIASATVLYPMLAEYYLRSRGLWSAKGKAIPKRLAEVDALFSEKFCDAFRVLFERGETEGVIALCEEVLATSGGWLFAGYELAAPDSWRL